METEELYYKKVFIKSAEDLPKEEGEYLALKKGDYNPLNLVDEIGNTAMTNYWLRHIDWWLKPVADLRPVGTGEIIKCIDAEPELPGLIPDEIFLAAQDKGSLTELLRITVRETKKGIKERVASELSKLKDGLKESSLTDEFSRPYSMSEYTHQIERMTKILGKRPAVFEQGVNALLLMIEQPTIARSQLEVKESGQNNVMDNGEIQSFVNKVVTEYYKTDGTSFIEMCNHIEDWLRSRLQPAKITNEEKEAIEFIAENPDCEKYWLSKVRHFMNGDEPVDDSCELADEWQKQFEIAIKAFLTQYKPATTDETIKKISCQFFRHWWNSPGNNTEQGFDVWWKQNKHKYLQPAKTICVNCDELKSCSNICMDCVKKIVDENMQPPKDSKLTDEEIEKCSYQYLSDVSESTNTERKYEKIGFIKGAKAALSGQIEKWVKRNKE